MCVQDRGDAALSRSLEDEETDAKNSHFEKKANLSTHGLSYTTLACFCPRRAETDRPRLEKREREAHPKFVSFLQ